MKPITIMHVTSHAGTPEENTRTHVLEHNLQSASLDEWRKAKAEADASLIPTHLPLSAEQAAAIEAVCADMIAVHAPNDPSIRFADVLERVCRKVVAQGIYDTQVFAYENDEINAAIVRGEP